VSDLVGNIGPSITDIAVHFSHHSNVLVAIEKGILLVSAGHPRSPRSTVRCFVSLETSIGENDD